MGQANQTIHSDTTKQRVNCGWVLISVGERASQTNQYLEAPRITHPVPVSLHTQMVGQLRTGFDLVQSVLGVFRIVLLQPLTDRLIQLRSHSDYLVTFLVGHGAYPIVGHHIPLSAELL